MKSVNIRSLRHETTLIMERIAMGESLEVRRHNQPVAVISPIQVSKALRERPKFRGRLHSIYGDQVLPETATTLLSEDRGER